MFYTLIQKSKKKIAGMNNYSFGLLRRLYDWVLSWAETKYATLVLAIVAFAESSFFPVPPDVLHMALSISKPKKTFWYATIGTIFSVLGGIFGYYIGLFLFDTVGRFIINTFGYQQEFIAIGILFKKNAFLAILAAAFTPIPYKVFTIASGFWNVGLWPLIVASILGRGGRFFLESILIHFFGAKVKYFIDKYFNWATLIFFALMILGFIIVKYLFNSI